MNRIEFKPPKVIPGENVRFSHYAEESIRSYTSAFEFNDLTYYFFTFHTVVPVKLILVRSSFMTKAMGQDEGYMHPLLRIDVVYQDGKSANTHAFEKNDYYFRQGMLL